MTIELEDADFLRDVDSGLDELEHATDQVSIEAAEQGVEAVQAEHPYTDRTYFLSGGAHVEPNTGSDEPGRGASIVWPAPYASFVQQGTGDNRQDLPPDAEPLEVGVTAGNGGSQRASDNRPYPFVEVAIDRAENVVNAGLDMAVDKFERCAE